MSRQSTGDEGERQGSGEEPKPTKRQRKARAKPSANGQAEKPQPKPQTSKPRPKPNPKPPAKPAASDQASEDGPDLPVLAATDGRVSRTEWLWPDHLAWSTVAIIQGEKGAGKSTWMRAIAADVTGGPKLPGRPGKPRVAGNVLWFAGEEPLWSIVQPGLAAAGADLSRCYLADALGEESDVLALPNDCDRLARLIRGRCSVLVVIDPIFGFVDGTVDLEGGSVPARRFVRHLMRVAAATGALILLSRNLTKDTSHGALAAGRGSGELGNAARSVLHLHSLPLQPGSYGLAVAACNAGKATPTITYSIVDQAGSGVVQAAGTTELTADELAAGESGDLDRSQLAAARALIQAMLPTGELASTIIRARADAAMIATRVLQLAAQRLGITHRREGRRENTVVYWVAPKGGYPAV